MLGFGGSFLGSSAPLSGQLQRVGWGDDDALVPIRTQTIESGSSGSDSDRDVEAPFGLLPPSGASKSPPPPSIGTQGQAPAPCARPSTPVTPRQRQGSFYQSGRGSGAVGVGALVPLGLLMERGSDSCPGTPKSGNLPTPSNFLSFEPLEKQAKAALSSGVVSLRGPSSKICWNFLVIGAPQTGKSSFINHFRAVTTHSDKWPAASVGRCGKFGTTSVDPFPNRITSPSWMLVDTPGMVFAHLDDDSSNDAITLTRLFEGVPWKTRLVGRGAASLAEMEAVPANRPHHCIITISATDLIKDNGFMQKMFLRPRYGPSEQADTLVGYLNTVVTKVRDLMGDRAPFVVVTHWDAICPQSPSVEAVKAALKVLGQCIPIGRCYFASLASQQSSALAMTTPGPGIGEHSLDLAIDAFSRKEMLRLYRDLINDVTWQLNQGRQRDPR